MPILSGEGDDAADANPDSWYTLSPVQYLILKKWSNGDFERDDPIRIFSILLLYYFVYFMLILSLLTIFRYSSFSKRH